MKYTDGDGRPRFSTPIQSGFNPKPGPQTELMNSKTPELLYAGGSVGVNRMSVIVISRGVPLPRSKTERKTAARRSKVFRSYARAYKALYVIDPDRWTFDSSTQLMTVYAGSRVLERCGERRLEQLARMMRDRLANG